MLSSTENMLHVGTPGEMKRAPWLSTAKQKMLSHTRLAKDKVSRAFVCLCMCGTRLGACEYIKSVRYQQSTIHQMNKNNRSNPAVILLLRLWCHDVIGNYSSATTKSFFGFRSNQSQCRDTDGEFMEFQVLTIKTRQLTKKYESDTDTALLGYISSKISGVWSGADLDKVACNTILMLRH